MRKLLSDSAPFGDLIGIVNDRGNGHRQRHHQDQQHQKGHQDDCRPAAVAEASLHLQHQRPGGDDDHRCPDQGRQEGPQDPQRRGDQHAEEKHRQGRAGHSNGFSTGFIVESSRLAVHLADTRAGRRSPSTGTAGQQVEQVEYGWHGSRIRLADVCSLGQVEQSGGRFDPTSTPGATSARQSPAGAPFRTRMPRMHPPTIIRRGAAGSRWLAHWPSSWERAWR
jgi:hypothetical protein